MESSSSRSTLTIEIKSFLAVFIIPLLIVLPASFYVAVDGIQANLRSTVITYSTRVDDIISELHSENKQAMQHPDSCGLIREDLLFESLVREMIIVRDGIAICSSKRGEIDQDISLLIGKKGTRTGEYLFDINGDPTQRTIVIVDTIEGDGFSGAFSVVDRNFLLQRLGRIESDRLSYVKVKFGPRIYPANTTFTSDTYHYIHTSKKYGFSMLAEASEDYINARLLYTATGSVPVSLLISLLIFAANRLLKRRDSLVDDLKKGLKRGELYLAYQPIVTSQGYKIGGIEALIRWNHPTLGLVRPDVFIPLAEEQNLIIPLTDYVLQHALYNLASLQPDNDIHLGVNVPPAYLHTSTCVNELTHYKEQFEAIGIKLCIEVTERQMLDKLGRDVLKELRDNGLIVSIDDFGTGHTSLSILQDTALDHLKIDKCFVDTIGLETVNAPVLTTIIELGHKLKVKIVAEGVETAQQAEYLAGFDVQYLQGYHFYKPMGIVDLQAVFKDSKLG
ncbi:EAL domain-containing protein [Vibrio paucivorans]